MVVKKLAISKENIIKASDITAIKERSDIGYAKSFLDFSSRTINGKSTYTREIRVNSLYEDITLDNLASRIKYPFTNNVVEVKTIGGLQQALSHNHRNIVYFQENSPSIKDSPFESAYLYANAASIEFKQWGNVVISEQPCSAVFVNCNTIFRKNVTPFENISICSGYCLLQDWLTSEGGVNLTAYGGAVIYLDLLTANKTGQMNIALNSCASAIINISSGRDANIILQGDFTGTAYIQGSRDISAYGVTVKNI